MNSCELEVIKFLEKDPRAVQCGERPSTFDYYDKFIVQFSLRFLVC